MMLFTSEGFDSLHISMLFITPVMFVLVLDSRLSWQLFKHVHQPGDLREIGQ